MKSMTGGIKKLNLKDGDVVVIKMDSYPPRDVIRELVRNFRERCKLDVGFIILTPGQTIQTLDEKEMNEYGWFRPNKRNYMMETQEEIFVLPLGNWVKLCDVVHAPYFDPDKVIEKVQALIDDKWKQ